MKYLEEHNRLKRDAKRHACNVVGMMLDAAYKRITSDGFRFRIAILERERRIPPLEFDPFRINVIVNNTYIRKAWVG